MDLEEIVRKMKKLNFKSQAAWFQFYKLLKEVEDQKLYREGYPVESDDGKTLRYKTDSLSAWIGAFCEATHTTNRSRAQEILRAGRILDEFLEKNNLDLSNLAFLPAPETLNNIQKIVSREIEMGKLENQAEGIDNYIKKAIAGRFSRSKSRKCLKELRSTGKNSKPDKKKNMAELITREGSWLGGSKWNDGIYKGFNSFPIPSGGNGVVIFENIKDLAEIACHLILIATDKIILEDTLAQLKKETWQPYFDYLWVMVPKDDFILEEEEIPQEIGVLEYQPLSIDVIKKAEKLAADTFWAYKEYVKKVH